MEHFASAPHVNVFQYLGNVFAFLLEERFYLGVPIKLIRTGPWGNVTVRLCEN